MMKERLFLMNSLFLCGLVLWYVALYGIGTITKEVVFHLLR